MTHTGFVEIILYFEKSVQYDEQNYKVLCQLAMWHCHFFFLTEHRMHEIHMHLFNYLVSNSCKIGARNLLQMFLVSVFDIDTTAKCVWNLTLQVSEILFWLHSGPAVPNKMSGNMSGEPLRIVLRAVTSQQ